MRLDVFLFNFGYARSRTHALNLIKRGAVAVEGKICLKASLDVDETNKIEVNHSEDFASIGGIKLKKAIDYFKIDINNIVAIDIGASNGGFTDVLLNEGASRVYAVDVSECALPPELAEDERVYVRDKLNVRNIVFEDIGIKAGIITVDVSFISLKLVLPALMQFFDENTKLVALIKPQFELNKNALTKRGIVSSKKLEKKAVDDVTEFAEALGLNILGVTEAPHPYEDKNQEYLLYASKKQF